MTHNFHSVVSRAPAQAHQHTYTHKGARVAKATHKRLGWMKGRGGWDHWYLVSLLRYRSPQLPLTARRVNEVRPAVRLKRSRPESLFSSQRLSNTHATNILLFLFSLAQLETAKTVCCYLDWHQKSLSTITATSGGNFKRFWVNVLTALSKLSKEELMVFCDWSDWF